MSLKVTAYTECVLGIFQRNGLRLILVIEKHSAVLRALTNRRPFSVQGHCKRCQSRAPRLLLKAKPAGQQRFGLSATSVYPSAEGSDQTVLNSIGRSWLKVSVACPGFLNRSESS